MFYTALVVSNVDDNLTGKVEVYIPAFMVKQNRNNPDLKEETINLPFKLIGGDLEESELRGTKITESHTMPAYPVSMSGYDHGQYLVPEVGDEILVFFKDDNKQLAYYMYATAYKKGRVLDYGKIIEDEKNTNTPEKRVDQKVLLLTKSGHVICLNDTQESNGVIIKAANQHRFRMDTTKERSSITLETSKGHLLVLDDTNKGIAIKTTDGHSLLFDDEKKGINLTTSGGLRLTLDDKNNFAQIVTPNGIGLEFDDNDVKLRVDSKDIEITASNDIKKEAKNNIESLSFNNTTIEAKNNIETKSTNSTEMEASNKFSIKSGADTEVDAGANFKLESGADTNIKAGANMSAEAGANMELKANANISAEANANMELKGSAGVTMEGATISITGQGTVDIEANGMVTIKGAMITLDGNLISLGQGAASPVIKGMEFMASYNAHIHPTPVGPSGPPVPPMLPTMLSMVTMTK